MNREWQLAFFKGLKERFIQCERKVSIIIQGPLHERSVSTIPRYLEHGEVIVSCWDNNDLSVLDQYKDNIKIVVNKYSNIKDYYRQPGSQAPWIFQHHTTLNGLLKAKNHFSIKVRSDESYPDLQPLVDMLIKQNEERDLETGEYEDRIITSNIYFRRINEEPFHPSDHIISGRTSRMIDVFSKAQFLCKDKPSERFPEQLLCKAIIESKFKKGKGFCSMGDASCEELMREFLDIINIGKLSNHIWTSSYRKYDALYSNEDWCHNMGMLTQ